MVLADRDEREVERAFLPCQHCWYKGILFYGREQLLQPVQQGRTAVFPRFAKGQAVVAPGAEAQLPADQGGQAAKGVQLLPRLPSGAAENRPSSSL